MGCAFLVFGQFLGVGPAGATAPGDFDHRTTVRFVERTHASASARCSRPSDGGQIFGGTSTSTAPTACSPRRRTHPAGYKVSVETFDQTTGKDHDTFARHRATRNSYGVDGIFAGDVALITHYVVPHGTIYAKRHYNVMNPVTASEFTGAVDPAGQGLRRHPGTPRTSPPTQRPVRDRAERSRTSRPWS